MKQFISVFVASLLFFVAYKLQLPYEDYNIEHFEQFIVNYLPFGWIFSAIFSRIFIGLILVIAFYLLFRFFLKSWLKYFFIFILSIPFIINPIFIENFSLNLNITNTENSIIETKQKQILVFASPNCHHCKETILKLDVAKKKSEKFPTIKVISYNLEIEKIIKEEKINFEIVVISAKKFMEITKGVFPKIQIIENNKVLKKLSNNELNYAELDDLSK